VQLHWTSAYTAFGQTSLDTDVADLAALVAHLRSTTRTVVIMGHSTGSQDVLHYLTRSRTPVEGGIMQAPVSDREHFAVAADAESAAWRAALPRAQAMIESGRGEDMVPAEGLGLRITAYRLNSLMDIG
jgi:pimeloyl-ACP methyl ester carboxylesterase